MLHRRYLDTDALKFFIGDILSPLFYWDLVVCVCVQNHCTSHIKDSQMTKASACQFQDIHSALGSWNTQSALTTLGKHKGKMTSPAWYAYWTGLVSVDRLCGLVVRVSGYRYRGLGFDSWRYQIFWVVVGLEQGPLSLMRSVEELLE